MVECIKEYLRLLLVISTGTRCCKKCAFEREKTTETGGGEKGYFYRFLDDFSSQIGHHRGSASEERLGYIRCQNQSASRASPTPGGNRVKTEEPGPVL